MCLGLPKCLELNIRGFSHLKMEKISGGGPPDPPHKNHLDTQPSYAPGCCRNILDLASTNMPRSAASYRSLLPLLGSSRAFDFVLTVSPVRYGIIREYEDETGESQPDARSGGLWFTVSNPSTPSALIAFLTCTNSGSKCNNFCEPKLQLKSRPCTVIVDVGRPDNLVPALKKALFLFLSTL